MPLHFLLLCPGSFAIELSRYDRAIMVAPRLSGTNRIYDAGDPGSNPAQASSGHVTTRSMSPQGRRSTILTFATKKLSTGANGQKEDAASFFFVWAILIELPVSSFPPGGLARRLGPPARGRWQAAGPLCRAAQAYSWLLA